MKISVGVSFICISAVFSSPLPANSREIDAAGDVEMQTPRFDLISEEQQQQQNESNVPEEQLDEKDSVQKKIKCFNFGCLPFGKNPAPSDEEKAEAPKTNRNFKLSDIAAIPVSQDRGETLNNAWNYVKGKENKASVGNAKSIYNRLQEFTDAEFRIAMAAAKTYSANPELWEELKSMMTDEEKKIAAEREEFIENIFRNNR